MFSTVIYNVFRFCFYSFQVHFDCLSLPYNLIDMSKDTIKSLKKQNDDLKGQIDSLKGKIMKLQEVSSNRTTLTKSNCTTPDKETEKSLEYLSNEYDDKRLSLSTKQQIDLLFKYSLYRDSYQGR